MKSRLQKLLLHICCAPDATVVVERLRTKYMITGFFYNPNIQPFQEQQQRLREVERLAVSMDFPLLSGHYDWDRWFSLVEGFEKQPEGGKRCRICYQMRLEETARQANQNGFDLFATVLSVSPHKNAGLISDLGRAIAETYHLGFLEENFKKKDGFKRSLELSKLFHLYRQNYCGCVFSRR